MSNLYLSCAAVVAMATAMAPTVRSAATGVLTHDNQHYLLDGKPYQIISGEMHYTRIPRAYWRDRMLKARAMGLNTICTYVFWNVHEPKPGRFDFKGNLDIAAFVREAQKAGLHVILRPGPYVCSEWDFGGYPAWLLKDGTIKVRTKDPRFMEACSRYLRRLAKELAPLQSTRGGPIFLVQVENEYGSFDDDHEYMKMVRDMVRDAGFEVQLFTADGPDQIPAGALDDLPAAFNFGGGAEWAHGIVKKHRPTGPMMCGEFWCGWFDHWGDEHSTVDPKPKADDLEWMLSHDISVNFYMFHGGTNFGWMAGANHPPYGVDVTSYDYDSPLSEDGTPSPKFNAFRDVILKHLPAGTVLPEPPAPQSVISIPGISLAQGVSLWDVLPKPLRTETPQWMEAVDQSYGLLLYRTTLSPGPNAVLDCGKLRGYASVYLDGKRIGTMDRRLDQKSLAVPARTAPSTLDILLENTGRVNFGGSLVDERQGIIGTVQLGGQELKDWEMYPLPLDNVAKLKYGALPTHGPAVLRGSFELEKVGDTFLDMSRWNKGNVWINGYHLGRFWRIGPQQTLYVPGPWLRKGVNDIIVFDVDYTGQTTLSALDHPVLDRLQK